MTPDALADRLIRQLGEPSGRLQREGNQDRSRLAPALAYGRHRGPIPSSSRIAAVAVAMYPHDSLGWVIPLTLRPTTLVHHGGEICLPGGRVEPGETMLGAALREFTEELGVPPKVQSLGGRLAICGELATHYVYASQNQVHPVVVLIDRPSSNWQPDPVEVAEVLLMPLASLTDQSTRVETIRCRQIVDQHGQSVGEAKFQAPAIRLENRLIWGATAMILEQLAQLLH